MGFRHAIIYFSDDLWKNPNSPSSSNSPAAVAVALTEVMELLGLVICLMAIFIIVMYAVLRFPRGVCKHFSGKGNFDRLVVAPRAQSSHYVVSVLMSKFKSRVYLPRWCGPTL